LPHECLQDRGMIGHAVTNARCRQPVTFESALKSGEVISVRATFETLGIADLPGIRLPSDS
jgi:hypothetical protein